MARWKAHDQLFIRVKWTFFAIYYGSGVMRRNVYSSAVFTGGRPLHLNFTWRGSSPWTILGVRKLETRGYSKVKTVSLCVPSFWHNTGVWQTDRQTDRQAGRQTDGQICRSIYSACKASLRRAVKMNSSVWTSDASHWSRCLNSTTQSSLLRYYTHPRRTGEWIANLVSCIEDI